MIFFESHENNWVVIKINSVNRK